VTLKNDGRSRKSKASKNKHKIKKIKCSCGEMNSYHEEDIINLGNGLCYTECIYCSKEMILK